jgi:hypothetical protein
MKRNIKCVRSPKKDRDRNGLYGAKDTGWIGRAARRAALIRRRPFSGGKTRPYFSAKSENVAKKALTAKGSEASKLSARRCMVPG